MPPSERRDCRRCRTFYHLACFTRAGGCVNEECDMFLQRAAPLGESKLWLGARVAAQTATATILGGGLGHALTPWIGQAAQDPQQVLWIGALAGFVLSSLHLVWPREGSEPSP